MKKVSTAVAKQGRNTSRQTLTIGLDLGDRNSWYCVFAGFKHCRVKSDVEQ